MKAHRFWTLSLVVALAACTNDNPTGLSHVETIDGVVVNRVADLGMFQVMRLLVPDEDLTCSVIGFEDFVGGTLHDPALINVLGENATIAIINSGPDPDFDCGTGDVLVFDTRVASLEDPDLVTAGQSAGLGNVVTQQSCETDGDTNTNPVDPDPLIDPGFFPNDADVPYTMQFSFPAVADGWVVKAYTALDQEGLEGEFIALHADGGSEIAITDITGGLDGGLEVVVVNAAGNGTSFSSSLDFMFNGSGAIDNIEVCQIINRGGEGCTPGYWKQSQHFGSWTENPFTWTFGEAFPGACGLTGLSTAETNMCSGLLLDALRARGGGIKALARHAAAAWLNSASTVDFHYLQSEVETAVEAAFFSGVYNPTKDALAAANEAGCPLARDEGVWVDPSA